MITRLRCVVSIEKAGSCFGGNVGLVVGLAVAAVMLPHAGVTYCTEGGLEPALSMHPVVAYGVCMMGGVRLASRSGWPLSATCKCAVVIRSWCQIFRHACTFALPLVGSSCG